MGIRMEEKRVRAVIFDLDGVLVFTDRYHYQAWKSIADMLGIEFNEEINNRLRGVSRMESLEIILANSHGRSFSGEEKEKLASEKNRRYRELLKQMSPSDVKKEVRETLRILRNRGYALAVGSSSKNAKYILERTGLSEAFDVVSDGTNIVRSKPDPEVFLQAAFYLKKAPEECMVVEDAAAGIEAAKAAKMKAVAIGEAENCRKADYHIQTLAQLLDFLK